MISPSLFNQEYLYQNICDLLKDLPHLFITGPQGCGKTTLIQDIISIIKEKAPFSIESIYYLSSEKDRGIHTIRDKVNDFCKRASLKPNSLRFIIIDDCDTLPLISQQALRRPMETYSHLTRFIFASRNPSNLIEPIKSRCLCFELEPITPHDAFNEYIKLYNIEKTKDTHELFLFIISNFVGLYELKSILKLYKFMIQSNPHPIVLKELKILLSTSTPHTKKLVESIYEKNENQIRESITKLYFEGYLLDDILLSIEKQISIFPNTNPEKRFRILKFVMLGWISIQQGKEHWLDTMDLVEQIVN